nr:hypothetical protein [uncultured Lacibacter sp.]
MNKLKKTLLAVFFSFGLLTVAAQENETAPSPPRYVSKKGFWVVQSNTNVPTSSTIYFYTINNRLLYKEEIEGMRLNLNRNKVKMRLKRALEKTIAAHERGELTAANDRIVASVLRTK